MTHIHPVEKHQDWDQFIAYPFELYKNNAFWASPPQVAIRDQLNHKKNPFFEHALFEGFLAFKDNQCVGRIAAIIDHDYNAFHQTQTALFGYFDCIDDPEVAEKLMEAVEAFSKKHQMQHLLGPINLSTNYECGLLIEGFEDQPTVMMSYHPAYYQKLIENLQFAKAKDVFTYELTKEHIQQSEKQKRILGRIKERAKITFRHIHMDRFDEEIDMILDIYNDAWEKNWGFVPLKPKEFRHIAQEMKMILDPKMCLIALVNGEPAGFSLALPDVNQVFKKIHNGTLFPFGLFQLLYFLKFPQKKTPINRIRILTLGIKKKYVNLGVGALLYSHYEVVGPQQGFLRGEAGWILEDNTAMNNALLQLNAKKTKVYRLFEKSLV